MALNETAPAAPGVKPSVLAVQFAGIPAELKREARWCAWKYVLSDKGKWVKTPINARTAGNAQSSNQATWADYDTAFDAMFANPDLAGLGFFLGDGWTGIDIDDCYEPLDGFSQLALDVLDGVPGYAELSPGGAGVKIFTRAAIPGSKADHKLGLEMYDNGRFFTVTGHAVPARDNAIPASTNIDGVYARYFGAFAPSTQLAGYDPLVNAKGPLSGWDLERVEAELLPLLSADCSYQEWFETGMALHHQGEADDAWLDAWDDWSAGAPERYTEGLTEEKWATFSEQRMQGRGAITLASLIQRVQQQQAEVRHARADHWRTQINAAMDRQQLLEDLPKLIARDLSLDSMAREELAQALQKQIKTATGTKQPIAAMRTLLTPVVEQADNHAPDWVKSHVYVTVGDTFFDKVTKSELTRASFNAIHDRRMVKDDFGMPREHAADAAIGRWEIEVVNRIDYHPKLPERYSFEGVDFVNRYNPDQVPVAPPVLIDDEQAAVDTVRAHIAHLFPDTREQQLIESWLAFVVQNPGTKVRWAPYICGPDGDGKSFFVELLAQAMGSLNVNTVPGSIFESSTFSDWAIGQCVTGIEEMKLHGHNKFDATNMLKPYITNDTIAVHPKGKSIYKALNTTQYIIFSNYMDGVPITDSDRRYCFFRTRFSAQSIAAFKAQNPDYYEKLFDAARNYPGAMRYWLLHFADQHPDFNANGNAPITAMRQLVISMSESDVDSACQDVVREKAPGVTASWVSSTAFVDAVQAKLGSDSSLGRQALARIASQFLSSNGYIYMGAEKHRVGPNRVLSRFWRHEAESPPQSDWWLSASVVIEESYSSASAQGFLD